MATTPTRPQPVVEQTNRLTYDDEVFLRTRTVLDTPVIGQTVWRIPAIIPTEQVQALVDAMARGPINRVVVRSKIPGARARWVRSSVVPQVRPAPMLEPDQVSDWIDSTLGFGSDPYRGPMWSLFVAHTTEDESFIVYNADHIVSDGGMKTGAVLSALGHITSRRLPVDDLAAAQVTLGDELRESASMWAAAARGVVTALRQSRTRTPSPTAGSQTAEQRPVPPKQPDDAVAELPPLVTFEIPRELWHETARAGGGTSNGLFVAFTTELLLEAGIAEPGRPVKVSMPVSLRGEDDWRSNITSGVSIAVDTEERDGVARVTDLAHIRARSKSAFTALADGSRVDPIEPLRPLLQALPDAAAKLLVGSITSPLCLASNLGLLDQRFTEAFGTPATAVLFRAEGLGVPRGELRRQRGGITTWLTETPETATIGVRGLDPDAVPDRARLRELVDTVCGRWGLSPRYW